MSSCEAARSRSACRFAGVLATTTPVSAERTIWPRSAAQLVDGDSSAVEVGVRLLGRRRLSGVRYTRSTIRTHVGNLWTNSGTKLATATFTSETASGWQQVTFTSPVAIVAGTTYVASYHTNVGHYGATSGYFSATGFDRAPLHALRDGIDGSNGVYRYGSASVFHNQTYKSANYWVDVVFTPLTGNPAPPSVNSITHANGATGVVTTTMVTATLP